MRKSMQRRTGTVAHAGTGGWFGRAACWVVLGVACAGSVPSGGSGVAWAQQPPASSTSEDPPKEPVRTTSEYNLPKKATLAIRGYDPVAYFPEGGGKAAKGSKDFEHTHKGVTYRFASAEHMELFKLAPNRYEPAHGGWCSWAMTDGTKTDIDPKNFIVKDGRLYLFYKGLFGDTRADWLKGDHGSLSSAADTQWKRISREEKRQVREAPTPE